MEKRSAAWRVHGRVQGVGYRYFVIRWANHLGLAGWTRNLWDGTVEVQAFGEDQSIRQFESALKEGPSHARVDRLEPLPPSHSLDKAKSFTIEF
jgi:acylphosphatase